MDESCGILELRPYGHDRPDSCGLVSCCRGASGGVGMTLVWWHSVQAAPSVKTASVYMTGKDTPEATSALLAST